MTKSSFTSVIVRLKNFMMLPTPSSCSCEIENFCFISFRKTSFQKTSNNKKDVIHMNDIVAFEFLAMHGSAENLEIYALFLLSFHPETLHWQKLGSMSTCSRRKCSKRFDTANSLATSAICASIVSWSSHLTPLFKSPVSHKFCPEAASNFALKLFCRNENHKRWISTLSPNSLSGRINWCIRPDSPRNAV